MRANELTCRRRDHPIQRTMQAQNCKIKLLVRILRLLFTGGALMVKPSMALPSKRLFFTVLHCISMYFSVFQPLVQNRAGKSKSLIRWKRLKAGKGEFDLQLDFWQESTSFVEMS